MNRISCYVFCLLLSACTTSEPSSTTSDQTPVNPPSTRLEVIIDTDANNELDDQHALAYLFFNEEVFDVKAVTVNATRNGGEIDEQMAEARRILDLCAVSETIPLFQGANGSFEEILPTIEKEGFDGAEAVNFIISEARKEREEKLILLPVGKLTNIALALAKAPDIKDKVRIVWLGTNYPDPGEYNHVNDVASTQYVLDQEVLQEWVMVRYGDPSGTDAVRAMPSDIYEIMPGLGPVIDRPVTGRHGGQFTTFGDYSVSLFEHADLHGDPPSRALFDMAAVAILKNPDWATRNEISSPQTDGEGWTEAEEAPGTIYIWEDFDVDAIMTDFYEVMKSAQ